MYLFFKHTQDSSGDDAGTHQRRTDTGTVHTHTYIYIY